MEGIGGERGTDDRPPSPEEEEGEVLQAESLMQALKDIVVCGPIHDGVRLIEVAGLRPRDVPALLLAMKVANHKDPRDRQWRLADKESDRVRKMKEAAKLLVVFESALRLLSAPTLFSSKALPEFIGKLSDIAKEIGKLSKIANKPTGVEFATNAEVLSGQMRDYIHAAAEQRPHVDLLVKDVAALLDNSAPVDHPPPLAKDVVGGPSRRRRPNKLIELKSLTEVFKEIFCGVGTRHMRVKQLRPRDVTAMITAVDVVNDRETQMKNIGRLRRMEQAVGMLVVLEIALLPALAKYPDHSTKLLAAVRLYPTELLKHARAAGGSFFIKAAVLSTRISNFVDENDPTPDEGDESAADQQLKALIAEVTRLLNDADVTVNDD